MILTEKRCDLFSVSGKYHLAHCISKDFKMGAGIAVDFNKKFNLRSRLEEIKFDRPHGAILIGRIFNLITKDKYFNKPTLTSFKVAIDEMRDICVENKVTHIATYQLGCTRDKLKWIDVKKIIEESFKDTDIEILICTR